MQPAGRQLFSIRLDKLFRILIDKCRAGFSRLGIQLRQACARPVSKLDFLRNPPLVWKCGLT